VFGGNLRFVLGVWRSDAGLVARDVDLSNMVRLKALRPAALHPNYLEGESMSRERFALLIAAP
jgi:hypothetical protein